MDFSRDDFDVGEERWCYAESDVLEELIEESRVLDELLIQLGVPGKASTLRRLSDDDKWDSIEQQIESFSETKTSIWYKVEPAEILSASIFRSKLPLKIKTLLFPRAKKECDLFEPVASWLEDDGYQIHDEIPMGRKRIDVLGFKKVFFVKNKLLGIELKNQISQLARGVDQMTTFSQYCHHVYLACTPWMAAEYLAHHAAGRGVKHWDSDFLDNKLMHLGFGLLLVEGDDVFEYLKPGKSRHDPMKIDEILEKLDDR